MTFHSPLFSVFHHACSCFQHLVDLTVPDDCKTELVLFAQTPLLTDVLVWQQEQCLFSFRLSVDHTQRVVEHWQRFSRQSSLEQERLGRSLTAQELRPLAQSTLLELLRAIDASA